MSTLDGPSGFHGLTRREAVRHGLVVLTDEELAERRAEQEKWRAEAAAAQAERRAEPAPELTLENLLNELDWSPAYAQHRLHPECDCEEQGDGFTSLCSWARELGFEDPWDEDPMPRPPEPEPAVPAGRPAWMPKFMSDCRIPDGKVIVTAYPKWLHAWTQEGRTCPEDDPCDAHGEPDSVQELINRQLTTGMNAEFRKLEHQMLHGDGSGEIKGLFDQPGIKPGESVTYEVRQKEPQDWSLRPETGVEASIVHAFDVPASLVMPAGDTAYDHAAVRAAQDAEWSNRP